MEIFSKINIKGEALIRVSRVEKNPKINKRASPFIRKVRVSTTKIRQHARRNISTVGIYHHPMLIINVCMQHLDLHLPIGYSPQLWSPIECPKQNSIGSDTNNKQ